MIDQRQHEALVAACAKAFGDYESYVATYPSRPNPEERKRRAYLHGK